MLTQTITTNPALDYLAVNSPVECQRLRAVLTIIACSRRSAWDSSCADCERGKPAKAYGKHRCGCGRKVKKEGDKCALCGLNFRARTVKSSLKPGAKIERKTETKCAPHVIGRKGHQLAACVKCGVVTQIAARGLGDNCYRLEKRLGTVDKNYPAKPQGGQRKKKPC